MTEAPTNSGNPFSARAALLLILGGFVLFIAYMWTLSAGLTGGNANDGGNHAGGKGLNGFAAFAQLLEIQGHDVRTSRTATAFDQANLLVLTPTHRTDPEELNEILWEREYLGPTLLILPKWRAAQIPAATRPPEARKGWVILHGAAATPWADDVENFEALNVQINPASGNWSGLGVTGSA